MKTIRATIPVVPTTHAASEQPVVELHLLACNGNRCGLQRLRHDARKQRERHRAALRHGQSLSSEHRKDQQGASHREGPMDLQANGNQVGAAGADINEAHIGKGCRYRAQALHNPCVYGAGRHDAGTKDNVWATILDATAARRHGADRRLEQLVPQREPRPVLTVRGSAGRRSGQPGVCLRQPRRRGERQRCEQAHVQERQPGHRQSHALELVQVRDRRRRDLLGLSEQGPDPLGHDLHRRQREGRHRRRRSLQGQATIYTVGNGAGQEHEPLRLQLWSDLRRRQLGLDAGSARLGGQRQRPSPGRQPGAWRRRRAVRQLLLQGAVYATNIVDIGTTAIVDGPLDGSTVILGQSSNSTFNGFTFVPVGMPGNLTVYALAQTPQMTGG